MVWGGIFGEQVIPLYRVRGTLNSERYTELLSDALLPVINHSEVELTYQQDNARCHVSRHSLQWFQNNGVRLLTWPAQSPDINTIENMWSWLKSELDKRVINNTDQLFQVANEIWLSAPKENLAAVLASMPHRLEEIIRNRGGHTHY